MSLALLFLRRWWPYLLAALLLGALAGAWLLWLSRHDAAIRRQQQLRARDTVIATRTDTAAARTLERRADSATVANRLAAVRTDTVVRWRRDTVRLAGDTTPRIAIPLGVLVQHDSAFAACGRLNYSCAREHAADSLVIVELRRSLALARTGSAAPDRPPAPRRWSLGVTAGWGAVVARDSGRTVLRTGPAITAGFSVRVF